MKPVETWRVSFGADEPNADAALVAEAGLGTAAMVDGSWDVVVLIHHGANARQAARSDDLRLVDGARDRCWGDLGLAGDLGYQHERLLVMRISG